MWRSNPWFHSATSHLQVFFQLPSLEDRLDSPNKGRNLGTEPDVGLGSFEEVQELFPDQVFEVFLSAKLCLDLFCRFTLLNPNITKSRGASSRCSSQ